MRLIDADELPVKTDWHKQYVLYTAIDEAPTIDAAPVVRCVNCIHYGAEASAFDAWTPFCLRHKLTTFPDDFCSYGEKRGDDAI